MYYTSGSGRIELKLTKEQANIGCHQGQCDNDIAYLRTIPAIKRQLNKLDKDILANELKEFGAWDAEQLENHEENLNRILWIACGDIIDSIYEKQRN